MSVHRETATVLAILMVTLMGGLVQCKEQASAPSTLSPCLNCHMETDLDQLIAEREIQIDFAALPIPDFWDAIYLGGTGSNTQANNSSHAFKKPDKTLSPQELAQHLEGDRLFELNFSLTETVLGTGLGPVFNDNNCDSCHPRDGRAHLPTIPPNLLRLKLPDAAFFLRISIENDRSFKGDHRPIKRDKQNLWGSPDAVPDFGTQLFHRAAIKGGTVRAPFMINGKIDYLAQHSGLADVWLSTTTITESYADGRQIILKKPILEVDNPYDDPDDASIFNPRTTQHAKSRLFQSDVRFSPRIGAPVFGLGLLEAIDDRDIMVLENSNPLKNNGITGRINWVFDKIKYDVCIAHNNCETYPPISIGRFGWKGSAPTVRQQSLGALQGDMGVTNSLFPNESIADTALYKRLLASNPHFAQTINDNSRHKKTESPQWVDDALVFYAQTLAVPVRQVVDPVRNRQGAQLFAAANCVACHVPRYVTGDDHSIATLRKQVIYPFTDLLLHDMGEGLADHRQDFNANGYEWRTRPLWGIGKTKIVNPEAGFLHDGRANTIEEAIMWHGGEADAAKAYFKQLSKENRQLLIDFINSL